MPGGVKAIELGVSYFFFRELATLTAFKYTNETYLFWTLLLQRPFWTDTGVPCVCRLPYSQIVGKLLL